MDSLELQLVRAWARYAEHLAGQHNQKSHGNKYGSADAIRGNVARLGGDKAALKSMAKRARKDTDFQTRVKAGAQAKKTKRGGEFGTIKAFLSGNLQTEFNAETSKIIKSDPKISPNLAKEQAAARIYKRYIDETAALDKAIRAKGGKSKQSLYDIYDELEFAPSTIQNELIKLSGSRTLLSDTLAFIEARAIEHLAGQHNQQNHAGGFSPTNPNRDDTIYSNFSGKPPWEMTREEYEEKYKNNPAIWSDIRKNAPFFAANNPELLVTVSPSAERDGWTRLNYYSKNGIEFHEEFKNGKDLDRAMGQLLPRNSFTAVVKTDLKPDDIPGIDGHKITTTAKGTIRGITGNARQVAKVMVAVKKSGGNVIKSYENKDKTTATPGRANWVMSGGKISLVPDYDILMQWARQDGRIK